MNCFMISSSVNADTREKTGEEAQKKLMEAMTTDFLCQAGLDALFFTTMGHR